ncbi:MAG: hypothetical protein CLLPBCKN_005210 [Chroococcidiopsis cubana SAG 39.79]|jgi:hypothetical protein|nr:hypothetical protein [Chroococcidiopsis cubana SAG 39.79]
MHEGSEKLEISWVKAYLFSTSGCHKSDSQRIPDSFHMYTASWTSFLLAH